jgi:hypothetical protein
MSERITGKVLQLLEPGDEQHYVVREPLSEQLKQGRYLAVVRTEQPPWYARLAETLPFPLGISVGFLTTAYALTISDLPEASQWDRRVVVDEPEFSEGDTVTLTVAEEIVDTETVTTEVQA